MNEAIIQRLVDETYNKLYNSLESTTKEILYDAISEAFWSNCNEKIAAENDDDNDYTSGFDDGYDKGYKEGLNKGASIEVVDRSYRLGYNDGIKAASEENRRDIYLEGYRDGKQEASGENYEDVYVEGFDRGYENGYYEAEADYGTSFENGYESAKEPLTNEMLGNYISERDCTNLNLWNRAFDAANAYLEDIYSKEYILDDSMVSPYKLADFVTIDDDDVLHFIVIALNENNADFCFSKNAILEDVKYFFCGINPDENDKFALDVIEFYKGEDGRTHMKYDRDVKEIFI